jgi:hypothetical protein
MKFRLSNEIFVKPENLDPSGRKKIASLCASGNLEIVVTSQLVRELERSPFKGVPTWFQVARKPDPVFILDHSELDRASPGDGLMYEKHLGTSQQRKDAILADGAETFVDIFVSQDKRARNRVKQFGTNCSVMTYADFRSSILHIT